LIRASTSLLPALEGVDAHGSSPWAEGPRDKPGQDEVIRPIPLLFGRKISPDSPAHKRGEGAGQRKPSPRFSGEREGPASAGG
jgi:hypothetical protein